jgi:hypothetical protein
MMRITEEELRSRHAANVWRREVLELITALGDEPEEDDCPTPLVEGCT